MKTETIQSLKELQLKMPAIIEQYGHDNNLTHIALANPIIALERVGFKFTDSAKEEIEKHARFGKDGAKTYNELTEKINIAAGGKVDLKNLEQIAVTIIRIIGNPDTSKPSTQAKNTGYPKSEIIDREKLSKAIATRPKKVNNEWQDSLSEFASFHPLIPLLIEYRQLETERPGFTPPQDIPAIEEKLRKAPLTNVVFSLKRNNTDSSK